MSDTQSSCPEHSAPLSSDSLMFFTPHALKALTATGLKPGAGAAEASEVYLCLQRGGSRQTRCSVLGGRLYGEDGHMGLWGLGREGRPP